MIEINPEAIMEALGGIITEAADAAGISPDLVAEMVASMLQDLPETVEAAKGRQTFRSKLTKGEKPMNIQNFKAVSREYWRARINGTDAESVLRFARREGLQRGAEINFFRYVYPESYNEWQAAGRPKRQRMESRKPVQSMRVASSFQHFKFKGL